MTTTQKLSAMTDAQLRTYLLYTVPETEKNFIDQLARYVSTLAESEATSANNVSKMMTSETQSQQGFVSITQNLNDQVVKAQEEMDAMTPSSMPKWLTDVIGAFMVLAAIATLNPALIGISTAAFVLQASTAMDKMMQAACGNDQNKRAAFEFGIAAFEAIAGGAAGVSGDIGMASIQAAETGTQAVTTTLAKGLLNTLKYAMNYLGQGLMMDNFWQDFFAGPCSMSAENSAIAGMVVGVGFGILSAGLSGASQDGLTQRLTNWVQSTDKKEMIFKAVTTALNLMSDGFQLMSGVQQYQMGEQYQALGEYTKDNLAKPASMLTLMQNLITLTDNQIQISSDSLQNVTDMGSQEANTLPAFGKMWKSA